MGRKLRVVAEPSPGGSPELRGLVDEYLEGMKARGLSPRSIDISRATLVNVFGRWAAERGVTHAADMTQDLVETFSRYLLTDHRTPKGQPLSRDSVRTYMRTLRTFVSWATARGDVAKVKVPMPKQHYKKLEVLSREQIDSMEAAATSERDKLIIRLLANTAIRLGELLALRTDDLIARKNNGTYIKVTGKGAREREVPVDPQTFARLQKYAKRPQIQKATTSRIFTTDRKHKGAYGALRPRTVQQMIQFTAIAAGLTMRVHPHLFRHSAITNMVNKNANIEHIRRIAGHANLNLISTVYSHVESGDLYKTMLDLTRQEEDDRDDRRRK